MTLQATEFIRRFLLHVLPRGFVKIRHCGYLANRGREDNIRLCRTSRNHPIAVRYVTKEACGRSRLFCRRRRFARPPHFAIGCST
jgi:hypothetical protein